MRGNTSSLRRARWLTELDPAGGGHQRLGAYEDAGRLLDVLSCSTLAPTFAMWAQGSPDNVMEVRGVWFWVHKCGFNDVMKLTKLQTQIFPN